MGSVPAASAAASTTPGESIGIGKQRESNGNCRNRHQRDFPKHDLAPHFLSADCVEGFSKLSFRC
jgi:hypothetical protein